MITIGTIKNLFKKTRVFRTAILLSVPVLLTACAFGASTTPQEAEDDGRLSIVTTIFAPYDFARTITGGEAELTMLLPPGSEVHSYEPTPQDIIKIQNADLFLYSGGETDEWVHTILDSLDTEVRTVALIDCVEAVEEELVEGMEEEAEEEGHAEEGPAYDEHVWTSPKNAQRIVQTITDELSAIDAANAAAYEANTTAYLAELDQLDADFQAVVDSATRKTVVFGDRFPFRYFTDAYGLDYFAAFPGCSTETEPSAATVAFLIDKINEEQIPVVFHAEMSNGKMADTISSATGAKKVLMHACHNVSRDELLGGVTYLDLMTNNVAALKEALS